MTTPSTEIVLVPVVNQAELNQVQNEMNAAFDNVAAHSQSQFQNSTSQGVEDGISTGGGKGLDKLKTGLLGIAAAVGAAALNAVMGADEVLQRAEARLEGIRDITKEAAAFSVSSGEYAQLISSFTALGFDQSDVRGLLAGFQAELENPEYEKFKNIADQSGVVQSMLSFIASTQSMSQTERAKILGPLGDEDAVIASTIATQIAKAGATNLQELFTSLTGKSYSASYLTKRLERGSVESDELYRYRAGVFAENLIKGGDASNIIRGDRLDRQLNAAHDRNISAKLDYKELTIKAEIASIDATNVTIGGFEKWLENSSKVINNFDEAVKKTSEMGAKQVLEYHPFSTDPNREKNELLDFLFRGPIWDIIESRSSTENQQKYTE